MAMARHGVVGGYVGFRPGPIVTVPRYVYRPYYGVGVGVGIGIGLGLSPYWGYPYYPYYSSAPVVVERNTIVEQPSTGADVIVPYDNAPPARSLLRDLQGHCYERTYANGRETRVELDPSECNF
ncbi:MAG TPA: hypothetical protein VMH83_15440 [Candidatus Acidoferrum sp.]|nr:hypothetical protein [Candidatus Acidoferrum sp.]